MRLVQINGVKVAMQLSRYAVASVNSTRFLGHRKSVFKVLFCRQQEKGTSPFPRIHKFMLCIVWWGDIKKE